MKAVRFSVSMLLLEKLMDLPDGVRIVKVYPDPEEHIFPRTFWVRVEGEQFREVPEGTQVPEVTPLINVTAATKETKEWEFVYDD